MSKVNSAIGNLLSQQIALISQFVTKNAAIHSKFPTGGGIFLQMMIYFQKSGHPSDLLILTAASPYFKPLLAASWPYWMTSWPNSLPKSEAS